MHVTVFGSMQFIRITAGVSKSAVPVSRLCDIWPSEEGNYLRECCRLPTLCAAQFGGQCEPRLRDAGMETPVRDAGFATDVQSGVSRKGVGK